MTQSEYIDVSVEESIMRIRLNRPARKNALTQEMYAAIITALTDADKRDEVRIVVIHADETCFSAGNDLDDFDSREVSQSA